MSAMTLKIIACISMILDHIGIVFEIAALRIVGRIAFPIYLYLVYNGYKHTSSKIMYAVRLGTFAAISQVPFSLFTSGKFLCGNGNVFVTLFVCLICIWLTDVMMKNRMIKYLSALPTVLTFCLYFFGIILSDYGAKAVLMSFVFVAFYGKRFSQKMVTLLGVACAVFYSYILEWVLFPIGLILGQNPSLPSMSYWEFVQLFSLLALPLIFIYNGKKGKWPIGKPNETLVQYGFYLFYPVHLTLLWLVKVVMDTLMW